jgi:hypothetical protein
LSDRVTASDDAIKSYAVVSALLGKNAGALISHLEEGAAEIREVGDAAGVMSEDSMAPPRRGGEPRNSSASTTRSTSRSANLPSAY